MDKSAGFKRRYFQALMVGFQFLLNVELSSGLMEFRKPEIFIWNKDSSDYHPYQILSKRDKMFSEYVFFRKASNLREVRMILYDPSLPDPDPSTGKNSTEEETFDKLLQAQNQAKEYYWAFYNASGALPSLVVYNTTHRVQFRSYIEPNDIVQYYFWHPSSSFLGNRAVPPYEIIIDMPSNSKGLRTKRVLIFQFTWALFFWRLSFDDDVTWKEIEAEDNNGKVPKPSQFEVLKNPCIPDMFVFSHINVNPAGINHVYIIVPLVNEGIWTNLTSSFCVGMGNASDAECGSVGQVLLTNDHILGMSDLGLFVSSPLNLETSRMTGEPAIPPVLSFHLVNPCSEFKSFIRCFHSRSDSEKTTNVNKTRLRMHFLPVCHLYQTPKFLDLVILEIRHDDIEAEMEMNNTSNSTASGNNTSNSSASGKNTSNSSASGNNTMNSTGKYITVLYAAAPYTKWKVLIKSVAHYKSFEITDFYGIFYHHQLDQFDMVIGYNNKNETRNVRIVLPTPKPDVHYDTSNFGDEFTKFEFPPGHELRALQVFPVSMDVFYLGNQLHIAESGGIKIYLSVSTFGGPDDYLEYCSFNHPDRAFICVNEGHDTLLLGKIATRFGMREVDPAKIDAIKRISEDEGWIDKVPDSGGSTSDTATIGAIEKANEHKLAQAFKNAYFTVSYAGTIQMWYLEGLKFEDDQNKGNSSHGHNPPHPKRFSIQDEDLVGFKVESRSSNKKNDSGQDDEEEPQKISVATFPAYGFALQTEQSHGPLVPFFSDSISVMLFQAFVGSTDEVELDKSKYRYLSEVNVGNNIRCLDRKARADPKALEAKYNCELYIRHLKPLRYRNDENKVEERMPGFRTAIYAFVVQPIPMIVFTCKLEFTVEMMSNNVKFTAGCECFKSEHVGWTLYIPGVFSVLIETTDNCAEGISTAKANDEEHYEIKENESYLVDMSTPEYKKAKLEEASTASNNSSTSSSSNTTANITARLTTPPSDVDNPNRSAWVVEEGHCIYQLSLQDNPLLKSSGGHIFLDLQDSVTFDVKLEAQDQKAQVGLQMPLLLVSNTNPRLIIVDTNYARFLKHQLVEVGIRPTGFGVGTTTLVVRTLICSNRCAQPCSFTFIIQVTPKEGRRLRIQYPIIRGEGDPGPEVDPIGPLSNYYDIPVNYRPPSKRGVDIPLSENVYNSDPSKPQFKAYYRISRETSVYKKCALKETREECECTKEDIWNDDPFFSDCREKAFRVRRAKEVHIKVLYPPIMKVADQNKKFYLARQHLSVSLTEVNGREEYSVGTKNDEYLKEINGDKHLNSGHRFYNADDLRITCYGTGLFHFKVSLGDFDSFGQVTGYFIFYSVEYGLHDVTLLIVMFVVLTLCFLLLFCGFVRVRRRLVTHLPVHGDVVKLLREGQIGGSSAKKMG